MAFKRAPRASKKAPRAPKSVQEASKNAPRAPKSSQEPFGSSSWDLILEGVGGHVGSQKRAQGFVKGIQNYIKISEPFWSHFGLMLASRRMEPLETIFSLEILKS